MHDDRRGGIWLGDALRAARDLAPDAEALVLLLRALGLAAAPVARAPEDSAEPLPGPAPPRRRQRPPPPPPEPPAPPAVAAGSFRLPTTLREQRPPTVESPPWPTVPTPQPMTAAVPPPVLAARPLLAPLRRRALLAAALATEVADGAPDTRRIVEELAAGRPLQRLPCLPRRTLARGVEVCVDTAPWMLPYRADQYELAAYLGQLMPPDRVIVRRIDAAPPEAGEGPPAVDGAPLLLLTDFGIGRALHALDAASPQQWRSWAARQHRRGRPVRALLPYAPSRWLPLPGIALIGWDEHLDLGAVRRALHPTTRWHARAAPAAGPKAAADLARVLSAAQRVSPWLLREARLALNLGPGSEADFAASHAVRSAGPTGLLLQPALIGALRAELAADPARRRLAIELARRDAEAAPPLTRIEVDLVATEIDGGLDEDAIASKLAPAMQALLQPGPEGDEVAAWAAQAWGRFSPFVQASAAARQLAFAAAARTDSRAWLGHGAASAPDLPPAPQGLFDRLPQTTLSVELRAYGDRSVNLVIGPAQPATTACHRIRVRQAGVAWIEVEPPQVDAFTLRCETGGTVRCEVDLERLARSPLRLRALDGREWTLHADTLVDQLRAATVLGDGLEYGALVIAPAVAVVPGPSRLRDGGRVTLQRASDGQTLEATVRSVRNSPARGAIDFLLLGRAAEVVPLDAEVQAVPSAADDDDRSTAFFALGEKGPEPPLPVPYAGEGGFERETGSPFAFDRAGLLLDSAPGGGWAIVFAQPAESMIRLAPVPLAQLLPVARAAAQGQAWRGLIVGDPDRREAFALWDELAGSQRFDHDHDGRIFDFPDVLAATLDRSDAVVFVGTAAPSPSWLPAQVVDALRAGKPFVVVRLPDQDLQRDLASWPEALRARAATNVVDAAADPKQTAQRLLSLWAPPIGGEPLPAGSVPGRSLGTSLRAAFAALAERAVGDAIGLFRVALRADGFDLEPDTAVALGSELGRPALLFIHGEASSIDGSFGDLLRSDSEDRRRLQQAYGDRIFGFQYRSVTIGPIRNAIALAQSLPENAELHVIGFAAGGLLTELFALGRSYPVSTEGEPATPTPADIDGIEPGHEGLLERLNAVVDQRRLVVRRHVRIACPARGTPLYGKVVDRGFDLARSVTRWLPGLGTALALIPGAGRLLDDPNASPGLTALRPDGGITPLLAGRGVGGVRLRVLAVERQAEGGGAVARTMLRMGRWLAGASRARDDLVVPLASALGGIEPGDGVDVLVRAGHDVDHFAFMRHLGLRRAVIDAVLAPEDVVPAGFRRHRSLAEARRAYGLVAAEGPE